MAIFMPLISVAQGILSFQRLLIHIVFSASWFPSGLRFLKWKGPNFSKTKATLPLPDNGWLWLPSRRKGTDQRKSGMWYEAHWVTLPLWIFFFVITGDDPLLIRSLRLSQSLLSSRTLFFYVLYCFFSVFISIKAQSNIERESKKYCGT